MEVMLHIFLLLFVKNAITINFVSIKKTSYSFKESLITCTISGPKSDKFSPHLHCPLATSRMCYSNCTGACELSEGKCEILSALKPIYKCKYSHIPAVNIEIQYFIKSDDVMAIQGEWFCSYAGINSNIINITLPEREIVTPKESGSINNDGRSKSNYKPVIVNVHTEANVFDVVTLPTATAKNKDTKPISAESNEDISFKSFITKFNVVIAVLILLAISIVLNIIFCIRDSLIKYYIDNIKNVLPSSKCLLICICQRDSLPIRATAGLDRVLSRETNYSKIDPPNSQNNIYDFDGNLSIIPKQQAYPNDLICTPVIARARSFQQHPSPMFIHQPYDQYYMSMPRGHSANNYGQVANSRYALIGGGSLNGSEPQQEDVTAPFLCQFDNQGNVVPVKSMTGHSSKTRQSMDLINDCDPTMTSENASIE